MQQFESPKLAYTMLRFAMRSHRPLYELIAEGRVETRKIGARGTVIPAESSRAPTRQRGEGEGHRGRGAIRAAMKANFGQHRFLFALGALQPTILVRSSYNRPAPEPIPLPILSSQSSSAPLGILLFNSKGNPRASLALNGTFLGKSEDFMDIRDMLCSTSQAKKSSTGGKGRLCVASGQIAVSPTLANGSI
jgi:hypothetical protein